MRIKCKKIAAAAVIIMCMTTSASAQPGGTHSMIGGADGPTAIFIEGNASGEVDMADAYMSITMDEAKEVLEALEGQPVYVLLDVRHPDEFVEGHIPGAVNLPNEEIAEVASDEEDGEETDPVETLLPDKDQLIFVYCRSGRRSKEAAIKLASRGYTDIIECGGILDWTGEIETEEPVEAATEQVEEIKK